MKNKNQENEENKSSIFYPTPLSDERARHQAGVDPLGRHELLVRAPLGDFPARHDGDRVRPLDRLQPVSDDDRGATLEEGRQSLGDLVLGVSVEGGGGLFVE